MIPRKIGLKQIVFSFLSMEKSYPSLVYLMSWGFLRIKSCFLLIFLSNIIVKENEAAKQGSDSLFLQHDFVTFSDWRKQEKIPKLRWSYNNFCMHKLQRITFVCIIAINNCCKHLHCFLHHLISQFLYILLEMAFLHYPYLSI